MSAARGTCTLTLMHPQVEQQQADKLNFVMLNVDNPAWTGEKREYRVSGIPHFVFLDDRGQARGAAIGKLPKQVMVLSQAGGMSD